MAVVCLVAGAALIANVVLYKDHTAQAGKALVEKARKQIAQQAATPDPACSAAPGKNSVASGALLGVLTIPRLGLTAPVLQGVAEKQLAVGVGHLPTSAWPGTVGTAVLAAHDVTWFTHIDQLKPGDTFTFEHGCVRDTYQVQDHKVVKRGSPLYHAKTRQVVLETCWPTDALYWTPERYLVFADLRSSETLAAPRSNVDLNAHSSLADPKVEELAARSYGALMGSFSLTGTPDSAWRQSSQPLDVAHAAKVNFLGGLQALIEGSRSSWRLVAPGLSMPEMVHRGIATKIDGYQQALDITLRVNGTTLDVALTRARVLLDGQGVYEIRTRQTMSAGVLRVSNWTMTLVEEASLSPSPSPSPTPSPSVSPSPSPSPTPSRTPSPTPTATPMRSPSTSPSPTTSAAPSTTASATPAT